MTMPDPDKPMEEPRQLKGRRRAAIIDLKAEEVSGAPAAAPTAEETVAPIDAASPEAESTEIVSRTGSDNPTDQVAGLEQTGPERSEIERKEPAPEEAPRPEPQPIPVKNVTPEPVAPEALRVSPPESRPSLVLPLAAAAIVGLIFGGAGGVLAPSIFGGDDSAGAAKLAILDRTQQQLAKDQAGLASTAELEKLRQALAKLEAESAQRSPGSQAPASSAELESRISEIDAGLKALAARSGQEGRPPDAQMPAAPAVDIAPLRQELAALDERTRTLTQQAQTFSAAEAQLKALEGQVQALDGAIKAAAQRTEGAIQAATQTAAAAIDPKLAGLGQRLDRAEARIESGRAAPLFAAVQSLSQAFHRGQPFTAELLAAEALGAPPERLQPLRAFAERGAPTPQRLQDSFAPLAGTLAGDASQPGIWGYASRFVTVRPTEGSAGATPPAIVGSIEAALRRGDVAEAAAHWSRLPEPARNASAEWGAQVQQRASAAKALADWQAAAAAALRK